MPVPSPVASSVLARPRLREEVFNRIRDAIMGGVLQPGELLRDRDLERWLGASRAPIRDAIYELTRAGLVETQPARHTRVASPRSDDALAALHALGAIYSGSVRLATAGLGSRERSETAMALEDLARQLESHDSRAASAAIFETFERFASLAHDDFVHSARIGATYGMFYRVQAGEFSREQFETMARSARDIAKAVVGNDVESAQRATEALFLYPDARLDA